MMLHKGCVQLFHRVTHGVKNITQMRSAFVFVRPTERSAFLGATHQSEKLSHQQTLVCLSRYLRISSVAYTPQTYCARKFEI